MAPATVSPTEARKALYTKKALLYEKIGDCDWTPDGGYTVKGKNVRYVTGPKMKRTIRPLLTEVGLSFKIETVDTQELAPCGTKENHHKMTFLVSLTDIDTGLSDVTSVIVEGADAGDKAMLSGTAYAKRCYWINNFDIVDGLEEEDTVTSADVTANLLRNAIPESAPANNTARATAPAKAITSPGQANLSAVMVRAMDNALEEIRKADEEGKIMHEYYERAVEIRSKASCREDVEALMKIRAELKL